MSHFPDEVHFDFRLATQELAISKEMPKEQSGFGPVGAGSRKRQGRSYSPHARTGCGHDRIKALARAELKNVGLHGRFFLDGSCWRA
jgi:hypothetical protein